MEPLTAVNKYQGSRSGGGGSNQHLYTANKQTIQGIFISLYYIYYICFETEKKKTLIKITKQRRRKKKVFEYVRRVVRFYERLVMPLMMVVYPVPVRDLFGQIDDNKAGFLRAGHPLSTTDQATTATQSVHRIGQWNAKGVHGLGMRKRESKSNTKR